MDAPRVRTVELPTFFRMVHADPAPVDRAEGDEESKEVRISLSSEEPVERQGWFGERWIEILSHKPEAIDLRRFNAGGIAFLRDHDRTRIDGILNRPGIEDSKLRANLQWSQKASSQEVKADVEGGIRPYTSVGYLAHEMVMTSEKDGIPTYTVTRWEPVETSSVGIPADIQVGFGREATPAEGLHRCVVSQGIRQSGPEIREEGKPMAVIRAPGEGHEPALAPPALPEPAGKTVEAPSRESDYAEISRLGAAHAMTDKVPGWIEKGLTPDQVANEILREMVTKGSSQPAAEALPDLSERDRKRYSYRAALLGASEGNLDGLEREVHDECSKRMPTGYKARGGVFVPMSLHPDRQSSRAMDSLTAGQGAEVVFDQPGELIDLLRNQTFVIAAGARVLSGLTAPVPFPKKTSAPTVHWVGENPGSDVGESNIGTGLVTLHPKTMQGAVSYSRQLLALDSIDSEGMVREELGFGHSLAIDRAAIHGIGSAGEPTGVYAAADVQVKAMGGVPTYAKLVDMMTLVAVQNAFMGALSWMTTPGMAGKMMQTVEHATATMAGWVWTGTYDNGRMAGYPARATNQVSSTMESAAKHGILFGNWSDMNIGLWGVMELVVDPYTKKKQGMIEVATFQMADVILRHGQSFAKATGATIV